MVILSKSFSDNKYTLDNNRSVVIKGRSYLNSVSDEIWAEVKAKYPCIDEMIKNGYLIETKTPDSNLQSEVSTEAIKEQKAKQKAKKSKAVEITEG